MLTPIGDALGSWTPRSSATDPLTAIRTAWLGLVGGDVARAAQPVGIANDALIVITTSSAWSHQLAFLEPHIVRGVRELVPVAGIVRLRFRVGVLRAARAYAAGSAVPARTRERTGLSPARAGASSPHDALARFRAVVERSRDVHRSRGGAFCTRCAAPVARGDRCLPCADWERAELTARCQRLLFDAPWLRPEDVLETLPQLDAAAYDRIRRRLLRAWWDEMWLARKRSQLPRPPTPDRVRLRKIASSYVLLETKLDPNRLEMDSPVRRNALGDLYEFIRFIETHVDKT